jgi:hypothetical protein
MGVVCYFHFCFRWDTGNGILFPIFNQGENFLWGCGYFPFELFNLCSASSFEVFGDDKVKVLF